jgi:ADP-heptose:LPS heptosyltransferase
MKHLIRIWGNIGDAVCAEPFVREFLRRHETDAVFVQSMAPTLYQTYPGVTGVYHLDEVVNRKTFDRYWFARPDWTHHISAYFEKYKEYKTDKMPPRFDFLPRPDLSGFKINFREPVICLAVNPSNAIREWPFEHWQTLVDRLRDKYTLVQLGLGERPLERVQHGLVNKTTLLETAEILRRSHLLVSIDSGLSHLATAVGRRNIVLFGPVDPAIRVYAGYTIPVTANQCTACWPTYRGIKHCPQQHHSCMQLLGVESVQAAVDREMQ